VTDITYNSAGQMTQFRRWEDTNKSVLNTLTYNGLRQLTRSQIVRTDGGVDTDLQDLEYHYPATTNSGMITRMTDHLPGGEEVSYQYDALNRLVAAYTTGPEWGLSWSYDGFGNRLSQSVTKGSGPAFSPTPTRTTHS
jgi:YD repeat-containing protein